MSVFLGYIFFPIFSGAVQEALGVTVGYPVLNLFCPIVILVAALLVYSLNENSPLAAAFDNWGFY
eukprot:CAMPEP_0114986624 /NCGR_PEP_ID=MMETSP0216-20121206/8530_1 /TAXON_ID=223996 /ORGANISM="Protocruzia adherens, Strain Boccale" /LENGTH=64 /DNA_ID=CAMNT_0002349081 /DNA_START=987 /DNA_END=1178 /DNA_ORIENTATION=-